MDFQSLLYDPNYLVLGTPAVLSINGINYDVTAIDKTSGIDVGDGVQVQTVLPAAVLRVAELSALSLIIEQIEQQNSTLLLNGINWSIESVRLRPSINGERDGEAYLFLTKVFSTDFHIAAALLGGGSMSVALDIEVIPAVELPAASLLGGGKIGPVSLTITVPVQTVFQIGAGLVGGGSMNLALTIVNEINFSADLRGGGSITYTDSISTFQFKNAEPWRLQESFNSRPAADITGWTALGVDASPAVKTSYALAAVTKNFAYVAGGYDGTGGTSGIYAAAIASDGTLGAWSKVGDLPVACWRTEFVQIKNRLHFFGGQTALSGAAFSAATYSAPINTDGTLGAFVSGPPLAAGRGAFTTAINGNYIYVFGGLQLTSSATDSVVRAPLNQNGTIGNWENATALPNRLSDSILFDTGSRIYIVGGFNGSIQRLAYWATKNADGSLGPWNTIASFLPDIRFQHDGFCTENEAFVIGGEGPGFTPTNTVYRAPITDGVIGAFTLGTNMPDAKAGISSFITSSRIYCVSGTGANSVSHAPFSGGLNDYSAQA